MKAFSVIVLILLVTVAVFFFSKPSDAECIAKGKDLVDAAVLSKMPGYENPMYDDAMGRTPVDAIQVKDKFFWKEVNYTLKGDIRTIGYGYLGSFHPIVKKKETDL